MASVDDLRHVYRTAYDLGFSHGRGNDIPYTKIDVAGDDQRQFLHAVLDKAGFGRWPLSELSYDDVDQAASWYNAGWEDGCAGRRSPAWRR